MNSQPVKIKMLEWRKDREWRFEALSLLGKYTAFQPSKEHNWRLSLGRHSNKVGEFETAAKAMEAAQRDLEERILSAIEPVLS